MQKPHPPIMIGAGGRRMLELSARHADIIGIIAPGLGSRDRGVDDFSLETARGQVAYIREKAGERMAGVELAMFQDVDLADEPERSLPEVSKRRGIPVDSLRASIYNHVGGTDALIGRSSGCAMSWE